MKRCPGNLYPFVNGKTLAQLLLMIGMHRDDMVEALKQFGVS